MKRVRVRVTGRVQGVFFRETTRRRAEALGLAGWVRNMGRDCVEAVFEGEEAAVDQALEFVRGGPPLAHVATSETLLR
jgi:acylphosphatase